jgi:Arc/MetJ-type ribon-helix-helix transcriptional regulator
MVSIRPSSQDDKILTALATKLGVNASAVIRLGLRLLAEKEKVTA